MDEQPLFHNEIIFEGERGAKQHAMELLDRVLKEQGDLGVYGDLSGGIEEIAKTMGIRIMEVGNYFEIEIYPTSGAGGHDFCFTIDKKTGKRSNVTVGEVLPHPNFDR